MDSSAQCHIYLSFAPVHLAEQAELCWRSIRCTATSISATMTQYIDICCSQSCVHLQQSLLLHVSLVIQPPSHLVGRTIDYHGSGGHDMIV